MKISGKKEIITVTKPSLPPLEEMMTSLKDIWENRWLTNNGKYHQEFEQKLAEFLGVPYVSLFANGTIALLTALKALDVKGKVITTPYTFVATTHALMWNNLEPVFVDTDEYGNISVAKIEEAITEEVSAILPVHVYGNPCDTHGIKRITEQYGLKVIYDAAHAFGVEVDGKSLLLEGDLSVLSFHATKVFNTFEGGAIVCHTKEMKRHIDDLKNFGFRDEVTISEVGINGKMNEFQAALGLLQLKYVKRQIQARKEITALYREKLKDVKGIGFFKDIEGVKHNYAYFPIFITQDYPHSRDELYNQLRTNGVYARRYFYPLISNLDMYKNMRGAGRENLITANKLSDSVICLPLYEGLQEETVENICKIIMDV